MTNADSVKFCDLQVGDTFCIPFHIDHSFEHFVKLPFNKARCVLTGAISEFSSSEDVWTFEPTGKK